MSNPTRVVFDAKTVVHDISYLMSVVGGINDGNDLTDLTDLTGRVQANEQAIGVIDASLGFHLELVTGLSGEIHDLSGRVQANEQAIGVIDASLGFHLELVTGLSGEIHDLSGRVQANEQAIGVIDASLGVHLDLVTGLSGEIDMLKNFHNTPNPPNPSNQLVSPQLLLRKQIYEKSGGVLPAQTLVLENLNTYISDYTNQRPFIGKITGSIYTTQRYSMGGFTADVCYLGGINRMVPRVEYANMTTWNNKRFGLSNITLESEVPPTGDDIESSIDTDAFASRPNGTLTVEVEGSSFSGARLRYNAYVDIFIQIDTLLEFQDLPIIFDEEDVNGQPAPAIVEEYIAPSIIHQTETVPDFPLNFLSESFASGHTVTLYARYKIDYLKNKIFSNQYFKFLDPKDWKLDQDIFVYQIITEQAVYYVSTYNGYDITETNIILSTYEDTYHNQGSGPYDRVITPYFHSGPQGNALPTSIIPALVGAQTGLMVIAQETLYRSGPPEKQLVFENSIVSSENWLPQRLSQFGLNGKNIHLLTGSGDNCFYMNLVPTLKANGINIVNTVCLGSAYWSVTKEIQRATLFKESGYDSDLNISGFWGPMEGVGYGIYYIYEDRPDMTLGEYNTLVDDFVPIADMFLSLAIYGAPSGLFTDYVIETIKTLNATREYVGASFGIWYGIVTNFGYAEIDLTDIIRQEYLESKNVSNWEDLKVLDYLGNSYKIYFPNKTTELKEIGFWASSSAKVGGEVNGVSYGVEISESVEDFEKIYKSAVILNPEDINYIDANYYTTNTQGYNPIMLKFVQDVLGLGK